MTRRQASTGRCAPLCLDFRAFYMSCKPRKCIQALRVDIPVVKEYWFRLCGNIWLWKKMDIYFFSININFFLFFSFLISTCQGSCTLFSDSQIKDKYFLMVWLGSTRFLVERISSKSNRDFFLFLNMCPSFCVNFAGRPEVNIYLSIHK